MFRIEFFLDDKHVPEVLRRVAGYARQLQVMPVVEATTATTKGKSTRSAISSGEMQQRFIEQLRKSEVDEYKASTLRDAVVAAGGSAQAYSYYAKKAIDAGVLKKRKGKAGNTSMTYIVQR